MILENIIAGKTSGKGNETFVATNPSTQAPLEGNFRVATEAEINQAAESAMEAWHEYKNISGHKKAEFLKTIADNIESLGDELVHRAMAEAGLPEARIKGERGRTCGQLRLFATLLEEGSWVNAVIDPAKPDRQPMPRVDIRKMYQSIGPVAVFGASNFPLAFSTAGGDTASALASGSPVIVKGHPSHPGTHSLVSKAISDAVESCGLPLGVYSALNGGVSVGSALVKHSCIKAVGFTGSLGGGNAIMKATYERDVPIPVYAEMGSINPIFLLGERLEGNLKELSNMLANSINMGAGQFCTNPGIIVVPPSTRNEEFAKSLAEAFSELNSYTMLNQGIHQNFEAKKKMMSDQSEVEIIYTASDSEDWKARPTLARTKAKSFINNNKLHHEVFGPFSMLLECESKEDMLAVARCMEGQLTTTIMGSESALEAEDTLIDVIKEKAGRLVFNGVPTGVEVGYAMHHGGPYPSASSGMYTSVGTDAILRFVRPMCYQSAPQAILPPELKDDNPLGIWRKVDGQMTQSAL